MTMALRRGGIAASLVRRFFREAVLVKRDAADRAGRLGQGRDRGRDRA
jgi:hypothetical protein